MFSLKRENRFSTKVPCTLTCRPSSSEPEMEKRWRSGITRMPAPAITRNAGMVECAAASLISSVQRPSSHRNTVKMPDRNGLENEEKKNEWYRNERTYGKFVRTVPLPEAVKVNEITATFEGGVLEITVPLPETPAAAAPKKVEITGAEENKTVKAA